MFKETKFTGPHEDKHEWNLIYVARQDEQNNGTTNLVNADSFSSAVHIAKYWQIFTQTTKTKSSCKSIFTTSH